MIVRALIGAVAGAVAGAGFVLTLGTFTRYCNGGPGRTGCGTGFFTTFGLAFALWMVVAAAVVCAGFRVVRAGRGWWAAGIGSALWFVLILAVIYGRIFVLDGMYQAEVRHFLVTAYLVTACVAYAVAASGTGRSRSSPHGDAAREST
ncbi:hypothetical protein ACFOWZ_45035 [Lentzea rhizosphaerae]|uniref:Integral membrane protein n=1 Tax=Lentzea rhizosphaerae TaxID=2041025 RepID=A0ABV8C9H9_9PSEU